MKFAVGYQALEDVRKMKKVQAEALKVCECVCGCVPTKSGPSPSPARSLVLDKPHVSAVCVADSEAGDGNSAGPHVCRRPAADGDCGEKGVILVCSSWKVCRGTVLPVPSCRAPSLHPRPLIFTALRN